MVEEKVCWLCNNGKKYATLEYGDTLYVRSSWDGGISFDYVEPVKFCPLCGTELKVESEEEE